MSEPSRSEAERLRIGARELGVRLDDAGCAALGRLLDELERWNRAYNLTAVRERAEMVTRHLLDSLSAAPYLHGERVLDVGTGAGFPGLPLAVAEPARRFTLLDSGGKKVRFVEHVLRVLALDNVRVHHGRVEGYSPPAPFDTVIGRAFAPAERFVAGCRHLLAPGGRLLMMKGRHHAEELAALPTEWEAEVQPLSVPGLEGPRHLIILTRAGEEQ